MKPSKRVFSGIQPSGDIHVGNYLGAIRNWMDLLDDYDCIFCIVDYHAITIDYDKDQMQQRIFDAALVNIASGIDPERCSVFVQSDVPEHTELAWILNCVTPMGNLSRMTQFKDKSTQHQENINAGLFTYPVLQAADILIYRAGFVPVGEDQAQHIELARVIAKRFNTRFGPTFPEPQTLLTRTPRVMGTDGKNKMSKSMDNTIGVLEPMEAIWEKLRTAVTDENRKRLTDPGNPEICNVFTMHNGFSKPDEIAMADRECRVAGIGCIDCKKVLFENMKAEFGPIQERAAALRERPEEVREVLAHGGARCREIAGAVMAEVRATIGIREQ